MAPQRELARAMKRLGDELKENDNVENDTFLYLRPVDDDDLLRWEAVLKGPNGSPYEGGLWHLNIKIPPTYPYAPPTIHFTTKIVHPNIDFDTGEICLSLLKDQWSPARTLQTTLAAIQWLLTDPNPDSPLNVDIAVLLRKGDTVGFESIVRYLAEEQRWEEGRNPVR
ncbi:Peroxin 4 [Penicillium vulpinum]|nr:Peroxin 4 [Penicillium vulpinum]KAJ5970514.1 Peroxin 4 [Penicillium vulpinum]